MERVSIDFQTPFVSLWNRELMEAAGLISRVYYDYEIVNLGQPKNKKGTVATAAPLWAQVAVKQSMQSDPDQAGITVLWYSDSH